MLTEEQRDTLIRLARESVREAVNGRQASDVAVADPALNEPCGAFVTLKSAGRLRGCIGQFVASDPLWKTVRRMARAAAIEDPRFATERIEPEEVDGLSIEISVLSPLEKTDDPAGLELGVHGIYVRKGGRAGCFLPQVAEETGWSVEEFLGHCCAGKAGLSPDAWRDPDTDVYLFTAEVFGDAS